MSNDEEPAPSAAVSENEDDEACSDAEQASRTRKRCKTGLMMMIAFITIKSSLVPLIEGLCAQIYFRFEISVVCSHLLLFFFVKEKTC